MELDVSIEYYGSIALFTLNTKKARDWVAEHVEIPPHMHRGGHTFAVEIGCSENLFVGMQVDGELTTNG